MNKKPLIMMHMEVYKREIISRLYLAMHLAKNEGYQILIGNIEEYAKSKCGSGIYFNKDHGLWSEGSLRKIKENGYYVTAFDEEGLIYSSDSVYNQSRGAKNSIDQCDAIFLWGEKQLETINSNPSLSLNKKYISGSVKFDFYRLLNSMRSNLPPKKVLINTRFTNINGLTSSFEEFIENLEHLGFIKSESDRENYYQSYNADKLIYKEFENLIEILGSNNDISVTIRPHPAENIDKYECFQKKFSNITVDSNRELLEQILEHDCVIHDACTTGIEAMCIGVPVYSLRPDNLNGAYVALANEFSLKFNNALSLYEELISKENINFEISNESNLAYYIDNWGKNKSAVDSISKVFNSFDVDKIPVFNRLKGAITIKEMVYDCIENICSHLMSKNLLSRNTKLYNLVEKRRKRKVIFPKISKDDILDKAMFLCEYDKTLGELSNYTIRKTSSQSFVVYCE
ncbi:hypothetical protein KW412_16100 [Vibrio fluvialis]|nr:hypothetical protein [Vibrio fluvialis]